jgi:ketosteroid isomerase-like protein
MLSITESLIDSEVTTENNDDLVKQLIEAENSHDVEKLVALVADDVVIEDVPFVSWITNDRFFAYEWILTATQKGDLPGIPASEKHFSIRGCSFGEFENGKLKGRRDYWDYASLKKQLTGETK